MSMHFDSNQETAEVNQLNREAEVLFANGKLSEAAKAARKACAISYERLTPEHTGRITAIHNLVELLLSSDQPQDAEREYSQIESIDFERLDPLLHVKLLNTHARMTLALDPYGPRANDLFTEAILTARRRLGPDHPFLAVILGNIADTHRLSGRVDLSREALNQALEITGRVIPVDLVLLHARILLHWANLAFHAGRFDIAQEYQEQVLAIRTAFLGRNHPDVATILNNLGVTAERRGDTVSAADLYRRALNIRRTSQVVPSEFAQSLSGMAEVAFEIGDYATARMRYEELIGWLGSLFGQEDQRVLLYCGYLARVLTKCGDFAKAESHFCVALERLAEARQSLHIDIAPLLSGLAVVKFYRGDYREVEPLLKESLAIYSIGGSHWIERAAVLRTLGEYYCEARDFTAAESVLREAMLICETHLPPDHPDGAVSVSSLSLLLQQTGRADEAVRLLWSAMSRVCGSNRELHPDQPVFLNNLGAACRRLGKRRLAERLYRKSLWIAEQVHHHDDPNIAVILTNLGSLLAARGLLNKSIRLLRRAVRLIRAPLQRRLSPTALLAKFELALTLTRSGKSAIGLRMMRRIAAADERRIGLISSISNDVQRLRFVDDTRIRLSALLVLVAERFSDRPSAVRVAFECVARRKAVGVEAMAARRDALADCRHPEVASVLEEWRTLTSQIADRVLSETGVVSESGLMQWIERQAELEAKLVRLLPDQNLAFRFKRMTVNTIAAALPIDSFLVEFVRIEGVNYDSKGGFCRPARYVAFVLPSRDPGGLIIKDLGPADIIDEQVGRLHESLPNGGRHFGYREQQGASEAYASAGNRIRELVFDPILSMHGGRRRVVIATDGGLNLVPFAALPKANGYLVDDFSISYVGAARDVLRWSASYPVGAQSVVVASPDYDLCGSATVSSGTVEKKTVCGGRFTLLQGASREGERVAKVVQGRLLAGASATRQAVCSIQSPTILHFATHGGYKHFHPSNEAAFGPSSRVDGLASIRNPFLRSFVALAGANNWDRGESTGPEIGTGLLTAIDASVLKLDGTRLVVLSACESGWGEVADGEGVFGLRRSFELAGAQALVISVWKVPDEATEKFMDRLYTHLGNGESLVESLRVSQIEMKEDYPFPWQWGGFICQGNPRPIWDGE